MKYVIKIAKVKEADRVRKFIKNKTKVILFQFKNFPYRTN